LRLDVGLAHPELGGPDGVVADRYEALHPGRLRGVRVNLVGADVPQVGIRRCEVGWNESAMI
jgi:hypothetical protein